ncbi:hypothetical protein [Lysobacter sp. CA199]|uniref:hypothetical protein n=1 Tax=Lysobacter sp. CA199 TaxID=3455608 RepID=UPI003F8D19B2
MTANSENYLVIAVDYYDGEAEGLVRLDAECRYFRREKLGVEDEKNEYVSVAIDCLVFEEIASLVGASVFQGVFVYSGSNHVADKKLDEFIPVWRLQCERIGQKSRGHSYFGSISAG